MAHVNKEMDLARRSGKTGQKRSRGRGEGWVRKNVVMDQRKLDAARRVLGVETETEARSTLRSTSWHSAANLFEGLPPSDARAASKTCSRSVAREVRARYERVRGCVPR
jgi:hypothetical protein